jgi:hypothetical protein
VLSWLRPAAPHRILLRYKDLAREPRAAVERTMATLLPDLRPLTDAQIPSFAELQETEGGFFRRGHMASHLDKLPHELLALFWTQPGNATAMRLLGYTEFADDGHPA